MANYLDGMAGGKHNSDNAIAEFSTKKKSTSKRTLIIHNADKSTDFLKPIYKGMHNKTVVTGNVTTEQLTELIKTHDRIFMMGHGWTTGLFNINNIGNDELTIAKHNVELLREKECVFIWCKAHVFVSRHSLKGFNTDMFVSEVGEAHWFRMFPTQEQVDESNDTFVAIFRKFRTKDGITMHRRTKHQYGKLAQTNIIAEYNNKRLYYNK